MKTAALSHIGNVRTTNEDSILVHMDKPPYYMLVADGMGGQAAGEVASGMVCLEIEKYIDELNVENLNEMQILSAIRSANQQLIDEVAKNSALQGMGTTLTFTAFSNDKITVAQVGDSRAYHKQGDKIYKITKDHTYVQHLIDSGVIKKGTADDYPFKNIITRSVGMKNVEVDFFMLTWQEDDIILLCSDGLTNYTNNDILLAALLGTDALEQKAQKLIDIALDGGGKDNISVVLAQRSDKEGAV
ncbi:MAG: Stp1/IreP family PP2C-type Ser/Thr phosphatase [Christensenella sp.]